MQKTMEFPKTVLFYAVFGKQFPFFRAKAPPFLTKEA